MKKIISYYLLFCFAFLLITCKKYPEGPLLSLRTKMARITGVWEVEYYEVDNIDSTSHLVASPYSYGFYFQKGPSSCVGDGMHPLDLLMNNQDPSRCGGWDLSTNKNSILIGLNSSAIGFFPIMVEWKGRSWEIKRLTNKEFWLQLPPDNANPHSYYMKLKKMSEKP